VNFPSIDLHFWPTSGLSKLASAIGNLLFTDRYIAKKERISYAKALVEANVSSVFSMTAFIWDPFSNMIT